jgi:hypothetical protein
MSGAVSFAFALGFLAVIAPAGLAWALAAIGLNAGSQVDASLLVALRRKCIAGALTGLVFTLVLLLGSLLYGLDADIAEALAIPNLLISVALLGLGLVFAFRPSRPSGPGAAVAFALAYGVISLPGTAGVVHRLLERSTEQGAGGAIGAAILLIAGAATAFALLAAAGALAGKALGGARRLVGAVAVIAGGTISAIYWLPDARGGVDDPGSGFGETLADVSRNVGEVFAGAILIPALLFLAGAVWTLARTARAGRA